MARQKRAIATRARIVKAASECFSENGYRATRITDILDRAQCTNGTLLFHFPAKVDIANEIIGQQHDIVMKAAREAAGESSDSGIEDILVISATLANLIAESATVRAGLRLSTESLAEFGANVTKPYVEWIKYATHVLEKARNAGELADGVVVQDLAEVIVSAFTGAQYLSATISNSADLPVRLTKLWPILFSQVSTAVYTEQAVKDVLNRHSVPIPAVTETAA
ncbi:MAG: ScbR family autoregulator-binding transcription factor [Leucobacter sp.]